MLCGVNRRIFGLTGNAARAWAISLPDGAQTWQRAWVRMCVGASCSSNRSSTWYKLRPLPTRSATAVSISRKDIFSNSSAGLTTMGLAFAGAGKSHSCETPTSRSARPRAKTISVAAGRNDIRRSSVISLKYRVSDRAQVFHRAESTVSHWNSFVKDALPEELHKLVCASQLDL